MTGLLGELDRVSPLGAWPTIVAGVLLMAGMAVVAIVRRRWARVLAWVLLALVLAWLVVATMREGGGEHGVNLIPGAGIRSVTRGGADPAYTLVNLAGNVLVFIPVGWLSHAALRSGVLWTTVGCCLLSIAIEAAQYLAGRSSDIDDVILNTVGGLIGALLAAGLGRLGTRREPRGA